LSENAKDRLDNARLQIKGLPISEKAQDELCCNQCRPTLEIPEDKDGSHTANIRATLASYNLPNSSGKENLKQLTNFAAMNGKKLVLKKYVVPVQKDEVPKPQAKEPKKEIKCKAQEPAQEKPKKILKCKTSGKVA
jgi:cell envelope opacity-associated protein A